MGFLERWSGWLGALVAVGVLVALWQILWEDDSLEARDIRGRTPLIVAAEEGNAKKVRSLVGKGARIDAGDDCNWTAMMRAASGGHTDILVYLLDNGADIDHLEKTGYSALMGAVVNNRPESVKILIERGAELDVQEKENDQTALIWAVRNRNPELVRLLLTAGADPDIENRKGQTAKDLVVLASVEEESEEVGLICEALGCEAELESGKSGLN